MMIGIAVLIESLRVLFSDRQRTFGENRVTQVTAQAPQEKIVISVDEGKRTARAAPEPGKPAAQLPAPISGGPKSALPLWSWFYSSCVL